jgi:hypothetical protein
VTVIVFAVASIFQLSANQGPIVPFGENRPRLSTHVLDVTKSNVVSMDGGLPSPVASEVVAIFKMPPDLGPAVGFGTAVAPGADVGAGALVGATWGVHAATINPVPVTVTTRKNSRRVICFVLISPPSLDQKQELHF